MTFASSACTSGTSTANPRSILRLLPRADRSCHRAYHAAGTPVAEHTRTGFTAVNKPVRVMISIVPGDTLVLRYVIPT